MGNEETKQTIKKGFNSLVTRYWINVLMLVLGGISGAVAIAVNFNPRVSALETEHLELKKTITILGQNDLEQTTKLNMIILYNIPASEREKLRREAESITQQEVKLGNP